MTNSVHIASTQSVTVNGTTRDASLSSHALSFEWFVLSFEFFMIVILLVLTFMKKLATFHSAVNANLAFCSALWAIFANQFYQIVRNAEGTALYTALSDAGYYPTSRSNTLIAGACILIAGNFLAMFGACWDDDDDTFSSKPAKVGV